MAVTLAWTGPPVHIVGLGVELGEGLQTNALHALEQAQLVIGARRHLTALPALAADTLPYPSPLNDLQALLQNHADKRVALLASGDPLFYGIGAHLKRFLPDDKLVFHPNISSIQAAFARLKRPWQQARVISLHGRPPDGLRAALRANRLYALLTDRASNPPAVARLLTANGFADSELWIAEALGTTEERLSHFRAQELARAEDDFSELNVIILETRSNRGLLPEFPGINDEHFHTDGEPGKGMLSKRETRLAILSLLAPRAEETGWDVGAGCGGVAVEWARWNPLGTVYAVECHAERLRCLEQNRRRFGVLSNLHIRSGQAPAALAGLPAPDAVFVGGGGAGLSALLEQIWRRLKPTGRLVASAVTEDSRMALYRFAGERPATWTEISVARGARLGGQRLLRPQLPVLLMKLEKP